MPGAPGIRTGLGQDSDRPGQREEGFNLVYKPHGYQQYAIDRILDQPEVGLFLDMGLGKTSVTLTAIEELIYNRFDVARVLVIAPLRVAQDTWTRETGKWDHLTHLKVARVLGSVKAREQALQEDADIYVINRENVEWLVKRYPGKHAKEWPFDMVVIDELSSFKSAKANRFRALRKMRPFISRIVGLTGTPAPNGYIDLWPQVYLLDGGARLGRTITAYREAYFHPAKTDWQQRIVYQWSINDGAIEDINGKLQDLCVSMTAKDYIDLPECLVQDVPVALDDQQRKQYKTLERDYLLSLDTGGVVTAASAAAATGKLQQYAQGAAYSSETEAAWTELHSAKLDALAEIIEAAQGKPVLVFYWFKHDFERLTSRFPTARALDTPEDIAAWNRGEVPLMLAHPASAGHGLNLQDGGCHVVWFALTWSLELYQQANARLYRQGQTRPVLIQRLVAEGTVDEDITKALEIKDDGQKCLMDAIKARIQMYRT